MITLAWRRHLGDRERAEVLALTELAGSYDDEAGFSRVRPPQAGQVSQLLVRMRPDIRPGHTDVPPLVGYLRIDVPAAGEVGTVQLTIHPQMRSLGIATSLIERLGLHMGGEQGWAGTGAAGLRAWAHGDHPAAQRMAQRFGATRTRQLWKVVRAAEATDLPPLNGVPADVAVHGGAAGLPPFNGASVDVAGHGGAAGLPPFNGVPADVAVHGRAAGIPLPNGSPAGVAADVPPLDGVAVHGPVETGRGRVEMYIDASDAAAVRLSRSLGFRHDRSDACYELLSTSPGATR